MIKRSIFQKVMFVFAILLATSFTACEKDNGGKDDNNNNNGQEEENAELYKNIIDAYINTTVVPTYKALAEAALEMRTVNNALKADKTDSNMQAAAQAWMKARIQWELSEAFLFGPVGEQAFNIDAHIDSWPLEIGDIMDVLNKIENGTLNLTGEIVWEMDEEVIGFHVTEYLLYRDGKARPANEVTAAELEYLTAATDALVWDCVMAYIAWVGTDNVTAEMLEVFNENQDVVTYYNSRPNYQNFASKMKPRTEGGNYDSWKDAVAEIAAGATEIADEVGTTKIASPYNNKSTKDVESWYSWHSLDDYTNNIQSIKNAYLGGLKNNTPATYSLSSYIGTINKEIDEEIKDKIEECIEKIRAIGNGGLSFYEVVLAHSNGDAQYTEVVDAAVDACVELADLFEQLEEIIE